MGMRVFRFLTPAPRGTQHDVTELELSDGRRVEVRRVRDSRARRLKLSVDERGARLTLPLRASLSSGERFLAAQREWLAAQLALCMAEGVSQPLRRGETAELPLRGQCLPLHWHTGRYTRLSRADDGLHFHVPPRVGDEAMRRTLRAFYESEARADLGRWLPRYLPGLPRPPARIRFKMMSSQWGSLAPDASVSLDLSLVLGRPQAFEYVLVHELCHLIRADHSPAFWREVEARCPDWRAERDYFASEGRRLKACLRALMSA